MNGPSWRLPDEDPDVDFNDVPRPLVVTLRDLRDALTRTWRTWVGVTCIGALLGLGLLALAPHPATATTTLLMVPSNPTDESAMTTDQSLLLTREVGERVIRELGLTESPDALLASVTATPLSSRIMTVSLEAPDEASALARLRSLVRHFLEFRGEQLRSVSEGLVAGYGKRITTLRGRVAALTSEYERASAAPVVDQIRLSDIVNERSALNTQVTELQQATEDAVLAPEAAIRASHVIDDPAGAPFGYLRRAVLFGVSGALVAGTLAVGTVLFLTLTSERLRRRRDIAVALGVPVRISVGAPPSGGRRSRWAAAVTRMVTRVLRGRPQRWREPMRERPLEALVHGLATALPGPSDLPATTAPHAPPATLGLVPIDGVRTAATVLRTLGRRLADGGARVLLVDLSTSGALVSGRVRTEEVETHGPGTVTLVRPKGDPALAVGPRRGRWPRPVAAGVDDDVTGPWAESDVVLALVEVDPGLDLGLLPSWVERIVPLVTAGRAGRELLTTVAALLEESGVELPFALMERADRRDWMLGHPSTDVGRPPTEQPSDPAIKVVHSR
ncbi:hypothetical protein ACOCJ5_11375 [Knoellia sp. CPCC 206450]|uniref:hypothetical protein n=1 Tax=Knoellia tibetensis TaxID=3404798 RepID=UPI003B431B7F